MPLIRHAARRATILAQHGRHEDSLTSFINRTTTAPFARTQPSHIAPLQLTRHPARLATLLERQQALLDVVAREQLAILKRVIVQVRGLLQAADLGREADGWEWGSAPGRCDLGPKRR